MNRRPRFGFLWMTGTLVIAAAVAIVAYGVGAVSSGSIGWWPLLLLLLVPLLMPVAFVALTRGRGPWQGPMGRHGPFTPGSWLDDWHAQAHSGSSARSVDQAVSRQTD